MKNVESAAATLLALALLAAPGGCAAPAAPAAAVPPAAEPAWWARLREDLRQPVTFDYRDTPLPAVLRDLREQADLNIILDPVAAPKARITLRAEAMPLENALNLILRPAGLQYCLGDGAVYVQPGDARPLPGNFVRRVYLVPDLLTWADTFWPGEEIEELHVHLQVTVQPGTWGPPAGVRALGNRLIIVQSPAAHREIARELAFLRQVRRLGPGEMLPAKLPPDPEWLAALREQLERPASFEFHRAQLPAVVDALREQTGAPLVLAPGLETGYPVTLAADDMTLRHALNWIARLGDVRYSIRAGALIVHTEVSSLPPEELLRRVYEISDLLPAFHPYPLPGPAGPLSELNHIAKDHLAEFLRQQIQPESWDRPAAIAVVFDSLVINHTLETHREIEAFLAELRAAPPAE